MQRLDNVSIPDIWQTHAVASFSDLNKICFDKTQSFLQTKHFGKDFGSIIQYKNSKGKQYENSVKEIYFHILMHSMYHRGQVAKLFRRDGINPPVTDYIFEMRDKRTTL